MKRFEPYRTSQNRAPVELRSVTRRRYRVPCPSRFPREHWRCIRTNNPLERLNREVRRRTRVVGAFPDGQSALMLVAARLRHMAGTKWGLRRYLDMARLREMDREEADRSEPAAVA